MGTLLAGGLARLILALRIGTTSASHYNSINENLAPLIRFLRHQCGRRWDPRRWFATYRAAKGGGQ